MNAMDQFVEAKSFGVVGASRNRDKYGNKVLRSLIQSGRMPVVIHPREESVEGIEAFPKLADAPPIESLAIITPPAVTEQIVDEAIAAGVRHLWMQPGAESSEAIDRAEQAGLSVVAGGPCLLVRLRFRDEDPPLS